MFGLVSARLLGSPGLEPVLIGALALPLAAMALSHVLPRVAAGVGLLLALTWTGLSTRRCLVPSPRMPCAL